MVVGQRLRNIDRLLGLLVAEGTALPELARRMLAVPADQLRDVAARVAAVEGELMAWHRANDLNRRLATIPGAGPITASAIVATVGTLPSSSLAGSSPLGWGWCHNNGQAAARSAWAGSRSAATGTFVG